MLFAVAALAFSSCSQEEIKEYRDGNNVVNLKFNIRNTDNDSNSKALLDSDANGTFLKWENNDRIGSFATGGTNSNNNPGTVEVNGNDYTLNIQTSSAQTVSNIYSYFPYSAGAGKVKEAVVVTIPSVQYMTASGFDADAMPMAGLPVSVDLNIAQGNLDTPCGNIDFYNLGSIINFKVYSSTATDETITSVKYMSTSGNVGGSYTIDLTAVDGSENSLALSGNGSAAAITTICNTNPSIGTGKANAIDVYMVVAPGTYTGSKVVVTTNVRTYTLTASSAKTYTRAHIKPMYVNIQSGEQGSLPIPETWQKVTSAVDFTAGTYYILRGDGAYYLPNSVSTSNGPACVAYVSSDVIPDVMKWTATVDGNGLVFESYSNPGNYLWGADNNNGIRVNSTATGSKVWKFTTETLNETTYYTATAIGTRKLISFGDQDWRNYGSASDTNIPAEFYKNLTPSFSVDSPLNAPIGDGIYTVNITRSYYTGAITVTVPGGCDWVVADNVAANATSFDVMLSANTGSSRSVTLTLSGTGVESQSLVINQAGNEPGTITTPYTVSEARTIISSLEDQTLPDSEVYVTGTISTLTAFDNTNKWISYKISVDGTQSDELVIYKGKGLAGADFNNLNDLALGDVVVVKGYLYKYGSTYELYQGSKISSFTSQVTRYNVNLASVEHGTISANLTRAAAGVTVTLTAVPSSGYVLDKWTVTDASSNIVSVTDNAFTMPSRDVTVSATFKATSGSSSTTLTNANIVAAGDGASGYSNYVLTDSNSNTYNAYAIKNKHSNATKDYHYLQIKKYASNTAYYVQLPELGSKILTITMTVSSTSKAMDGGGNTATLFFSSSNSTSATGSGVASGTGTSSVVINASSLNLNTGYITASAGVRIWDIVITYQ